VIDVAVLTIPSFMGTSMTFRYDMGYYEQWCWFHRWNDSSQHGFCPWYLGKRNVVKL